MRLARAGNDVACSLGIECSGLGLSRSQLGIYVEKAASAVTNALKSLISNSKRQVVQLKNKNYRLTDLGIVRVLEELGEKMRL